MNAKQRSWLFDLVPALCMDLAFYFTLLSVQHRLHELGTPADGLALTLMAYTAAYVVACPLVGTFSGRRPFAAMLTGLSLGLAVMLLMSRAETLLEYSLLLAGWGVAAALWWPSLQSVVGTDGALADRPRRLGNFNLGWTIGKGLGMVASGALIERQPGESALAFSISAGLVAFTIVLIAARARSGVKVSAGAASEVTRPRERPRLWKHYFGAALAVNLVCWGGHSAAIALIPALGKSLQLSPLEQGFMLASMVGTQALVFALLRRSEAWVYRPGTLVCAAFAASLALLLLALARGFPLALMALALFGVAVGLSYAMSLRYALDGADKPLFYTSLHEANLGVGSLIIPYLFGLGMVRVGVSMASLVFALLVMILAVLVAGFLRRGSGPLCSDQQVTASAKS